MAAHSCPPSFPRLPLRFSTPSQPIPQFVFPSILVLRGTRSVYKLPTCILIKLAKKHSQCQTLDQLLPSQFYPFQYSD